MGPSLHIAVAGAGVGGLACAIDLARAGHRVTVLERSLEAGGKMRAVSVGGRLIDAGPTVLTMPWVFEGLFADAGVRFAERVALERSEILARHAWSDGTRLDLFADRARGARAIADVFGAREAAGYEAFCEDVRAIFDTVEEPFLRSQAPTFGDLVRRAGSLGFGALGRIDAFRTMWRAISARFAEPKLRQLFGRYATYSGSSPFDAPATFNVIAHVESLGVWRVRGGMRVLAASLAELATSLGVELRCGAPVDSIDIARGRVRAVSAGGARVAIDALVWNGDVSALGALIGSQAPRETRPAERSLSAVTLAVVGVARDFPLVHHNVFFSDDYAAEFDDLARRRRAPEAPTVYVCAQDRGDAAQAVSGSERMLFIVNAPATGDEPDRWRETERARCERAALTVASRCGLNVETEAMAMTTPVGFEQLYPRTGGALYGRAARGPTSPLSRPGARTKIGGLYLAGGSVHPGAGVPMAALSGRLAAAALTTDLASTAPSRRAVTSGTTSMA